MVGMKEGQNLYHCDPWEITKLLKIITILPAYSRGLVRRPSTGKSR